jgi:hypothetical protein
MVPGRGAGLVGKLASRKARNLEQEDAGGDDGIDGATGKTLKAAHAASEVAATRRRRTQRQRHERMPRGTGAKAAPEKA